MSFAIRRILVLCVGNHCRSPMAEGLLRAALGPEVEVRSAGLGALVDHPAHPEAVRLLAGRGIDLDGHRGVQVNADMLREADLVLVMDDRQKEVCERLAPTVRGRVYRLGHWLPATDRDIADPFQGGHEAHELAFNHVERAVQGWLARLAPSLPQTPRIP